MIYLTLGKHSFDIHAIRVYTTNINNDGEKNER